MAVENIAWFDGLKNGVFFQRIQLFALILRIIIQLLALALLINGILMLGVSYAFKNNFGFFLRQSMYFSNPDSEEEVSNFRNVWAVSTINFENCLTSVVQSVYSGFALVFVSGCLCISVGFWRTSALDYTCLLFLIASISCQAKELKNFDNVLTPLQSSTMQKMKEAINNQAPFMKDDVLTTLDYLMLKGDCCGVVGGADMDFFNFYQEDKIRAKLENAHLNIAGPKPFRSKCWHDDHKSRNTTGCYVWYFEKFVKPSVRSMYGIALLIQMIIFSLIVIQSEVPADKKEALKILFLERLPSPFPFD